MEVPFYSFYRRWSQSEKVFLSVSCKLPSQSQHNRICFIVGQFMSTNSSLSLFFTTNFQFVKLQYLLCHGHSTFVVAISFLTSRNGPFLPSHDVCSMARWYKRLCSCRYQQHDFTIPLKIGHKQKHQQQQQSMRPDQKRGSSSMRSVEFCVSLRYDASYTPCSRDVRFLVHSTREYKKKTLKRSCSPSVGEILFPKVRDLGVLNSAETTQ